jgi:hypothetical protein
MRSAVRGGGFLFRSVSIEVAALGFSASDFATFRISGFDERMQQIYAHLSSKLLKLGARLAPELARRLHLELFPHVAKHARRTVEPPSETWAAFGPSPRGYKRHGYLALFVSGAGLHARVVVGPEADGRRQMAAELKARSSDLAKAFQGTRLARYDNWDFLALPAPVAADERFLGEIADGIARNAGGADLGFGWTVREAIRLDWGELTDAFRELGPLYRVFQTVG